MSTDKTLADVQPGGRVRLGDLPVPHSRNEFNEWWSSQPCDISLLDTYEIALTAYRGGFTSGYMQSRATLSAQPSPGGQDALDEVACDLPALFGRASLEGHEIGQRLAKEVQEKMRAALDVRQPVGQAFHVNAVEPCGKILYVHPAGVKEGDKLYAAPPAQAVEMSPEFTDTARAAIAWMLWHHQGGSSPVGQPLRFALGMGRHDRMTDNQIAEAKRFAAWANATTEDFHQRAPAQAVDLDLQQDAARWRAIAPHLSVEWDEDEMLKRWTWIDFKGDALSVPTRTRLSYASVDEAMDAVIESQAVGNG